MKKLKHIKLALFAIVFGAIAVFVLVNSTPTVLGQTSNTASSTVIVALGDSITVGVGATSGKGYVDILEDRIGQPIVNAGRSGDSTADALARLDQDVLSYDPDIVIVFLGGNDILNNVPRATMFANLREIVERSKESGAQVILAGIHGPLFLSDLENEYRNLATSAGAIYVPNILSGIIGNPNLLSDPIHPNDTGHQLIAERFLPALQSSVGVVAEPVLVGYCSVRATPDYSDGGYRLRFQASLRASGIASSTEYSWVSSLNASSTKTFLTEEHLTSGLKTAEVTARAAHISTTLRCSADLSSTDLSTSTRNRLQGSCTPRVSGLTVFWRATGGNSDSTIFEWSGSDGLVNVATSSTEIEHTYATEGIKEARVVIREGGQTLALTCQAKVAPDTGSGGGCFIATAAYGSELEPEVAALRKFRDEELLTNRAGELFVNTYYKLSPPLADFIRDKENLKSLIRAGLYPLVWVVD